LLSSSSSSSKNLKILPSLATILKILKNSFHPFTTYIEKKKISEEVKELENLIIVNNSNNTYTCTYGDE
jgi:hypothetical protein